jgi:hypothetical protein
VHGVIAGAGSGALASQCVLSPVLRAFLEQLLGLVLEAFLVSKNLPISEMRSWTVSENLGVKLHHLLHNRGCGLDLLQFSLTLESLEC